MIADAQVARVVLARLALYRAKQARHDPLANDTCTEHEKVGHTIEAFEWLCADLGIEVPE